MNRFLLLLGQVLILSLSSVTASNSQPVPFTKLEPNVYEPFLGTYEFESGELIVVGRSVRRLFIFDPQTSRVRGLAPATENASGELKWMAGPALLVLTPTTATVTFLKNDRGDFTGLEYEETGKSKRTARKSSIYRDEQVSFKNGDVSLAGTLLVPAGKGPHPAVVLLHGSGPQDRNGERSEIRWVADHFARHGIASLVYDKRGLGVAESTGDWGTASFEDLASDALAGLRLLQGRSDINPKQIGFWGISQAGWVMATASSISKDIAFIIAVSAGGSGYTITQQNNYNMATEMKASGFSKSEIKQVISAYGLFYDVVRTEGRGDVSNLDAAVLDARKNAKLKDWLPSTSTEIDWKKRDQWFLSLDIDFDPLPLWNRYPGPVLAVYGELDSSTPAAQVVPLLAKALGSRKNTDFAIRIFPGANHNILEAKIGNDSEIPNLDRFHPGYLDTMTDWLKTRVDMPK